MNPEADPLAQLRDIHLPEAIGIWPPAPGWWLLLTFGIVLLAWLYCNLRARRRASAYRRNAKKLLTNYWLQLQAGGDQKIYLENLLIVLRRTALSFAPNAASLTGESWLVFLDNHSIDTKAKYQSELGQLLLTEPYRAKPQVSASQLLQLHQLALQWVTNHQHRSVTDA
jgi:hypothetical protein